MQKHTKTDRYTGKVFTLFVVDSESELPTAGISYGDTAHCENTNQHWAIAVSMAGNPVWELITSGSSTTNDTSIMLTDNSANNASTQKHGFCPKLPNSNSVYLDGTGVFSSPQASGEANTSSNVGSGANLAKTKSGVNLPFRSVLGQANKVVVTENTNDISLSIGTDIVTLSDPQVLTNKTIPSPLGITKSDIGLGSVDNTSDSAKPVSSPTQTALDVKLDKNSSITGATKTKITYDAKGLVTSGADATTADIADSSNKRYVTDTQQTILGSTSGTNTGDQIISDTTISTTDITTNNATSSKHGFLKKLSNISTQYLDGTGNFSTPTSGGGPTTVKLTADTASITATALANVVGLSFAVTSGVYYKFCFYIIFTSAATTTGLKLGCTYPASTVFVASSRIPIAADGAGGEFQGWHTTSGDAVTGTGVQAAATTYLATLRGIILPSANGTLQLQVATEIASSAIVVKNASCGELSIF